MKWKNPKIGDERIITKFLIFPRTINNETRFMERVFIKQRYIGNTVADFGSNWEDIKFIDNMYEINLRRYNEC